MTVVMFDEFWAFYFDFLSSFAFSLHFDKTSRVFEIAGHMYYPVVFPFHYRDWFTSSVVKIPPHYLFISRQLCEREKFSVGIQSRCCIYFLSFQTAQQRIEAEKIVKIYEMSQQYCDTIFQLPFYLEIFQYRSFYPCTLQILRNNPPYCTSSKFCNTVLPAFWACTISSSFFPCRVVDCILVVFTLLTVLWRTSGLPGPVLLMSRYGGTIIQRSW